MMCVPNEVCEFSHGEKNIQIQWRVKSIVILFFLCLLFGGTVWGQAKVTVGSEISDADSLVLEVRGVEDASVDAIPVERTSPNGKQLYCAYDINITKDGQEWQPEPEKPAIVSMEDPNFADGQLLDIYHEGTNGLEFVATVASENGKITFPAHSFSVYIVAQAEEYNRLKVKLHQADGTIVTIYVKKLDITQGDFNRIVYNPGFGTIASGVQCRGWIAKEAYTKDDVPSALTIDEVRDSITNRLNAGITDGTELDFYTMLFKSYTVTYLADKDAIANTDILLFRADSGNPSISYTVDAAYTPGDNTHNFEGWQVKTHADGTHIAGHTDDAHNYPNQTNITITGDVVFDVNVSEGYWLIYHENGKGATYKAADFICAGDTTRTPSLTMLRNGYTFDGWWTEAPAEDGGLPGGTRFRFGGQLAGTTHVYAKWNVNLTANYTVVIWKQNVSCEYYDFEEAINLTGNSNSLISTIVANGSGNARYASIDGTPKQYTGFYLKEFNSNVRIAPEGNTLVNVYYDRIEYTVKFIYYRKNSSNKYQYATNKLSLDQNSSATGDNYLCAKWTSSSYSSHPECSYTNCRDTVMGNYTYHYYPITAKYGQSIVEKWPEYDKFADFNGLRFSSWVLMIGAEARGNGREEVSGQGSVKGLISVMNEQILGNLTSSNGNYLVAKYSNNANDWTYNIWFPKVDGEDYTGRIDTTVNSVEYYLEYEIDARSGSDASGQHQPSFIGFDNVSGNRRGSNNIMDYYYTRNEYSINYMSGAYYNGSGVKLSDYASGGLLHGVEGVAYDDSIKRYGTYAVDPEDVPEGFVFEGWYSDEPCTHLFDFNTRMSSANITVYAKWRQIQYRVFLHPNAEEVTDLDWGADNQAMCFRINYGGRISAPTGIGDDYEFVGWYTDPNLLHSFSENAIVLNEVTVTEPYDKTDPENYTDPMDRWGNITPTPETPNPYNSDIIGNEGSDRFWITMKYNLYGKWRAKLRGADGIIVEYVANGGNPSTVPIDSHLYQDNVNAIAANACEYGDATKEFSHWVLQHYNATTGDYEDIPDYRIYPGAHFPMHKSNALREITQWYDPEHPNDYIETGFERYVIETHPTAPDLTHTEFRANYTVRLRAEYVEVERPTYTFIKWLMNDGTGSAVRIDGTGAAAPSLAINGTVTTSIPPAPTRTGYIFKGWYKKNVLPSESLPTVISECTPNFLYYNKDNNKYYKEATYTNEVAKVASDKYERDDYLYAIWEPVVEFNIDPVCQGDQITLPTTTKYGVNLSATGWTWEASTGTVEGATYTAPGTGTSVTFTFSPNYSTCAHAKDTVVNFQMPAESLSSYDYIWRGRTTDWNTASNWYVYDNGFSIADDMPSTKTNIYIGSSQCVSSNWPTQTNEANAKDITIASNARLTVPTGKILNIAGNLTNTGTFDAVDGTVVFCGSLTNGGDQTISGNIKLGNVVFNNQGGDIIPAGIIMIDGEATFTNGIVRKDVVTFNEASSVNENLTYNSYVEGMVTKMGSANGFTFPTGSNGTLGKIKGMSNASNVSVQYFNNPDGFTIDEYPRWWNQNNNCADNNPRFVHVSNFEYWDVHTSSPLEAILTVSSVDSVAHFNSVSPTHDGNDIYGALWNGSCWENVGGIGHTISSNPYGTISVSVTLPATRAFSSKILSLGSVDSNTVLPIELLSFSATCNGRSADLAWTTASERNNDYFIIEHSRDAINFTEIARVAGAGNSIEQLDYNYTDYNAAGGDNYYRLVQVDYDGTLSASEIVVASCNETESTTDVQIFPNPFHNDIVIHMENFAGETISIEVYDMLGKMVMTKNVSCSDNNNETTLNLQELSNGTYYIRLSANDYVFNKQVIKQ